MMAVETSEKMEWLLLHTFDHKSVQSGLTSQ